MSGLLERVRLALQDRYVVDREVGRGAAAVVFQAEDLKHHRPVAIKVLRPEVAADIGVDRFIREIETVARLAHPHILPLFDSGETGGLPYFVMPFVPGESLRERIEREQQLPVEDAMEIARDVASALSFAHSHGVVHRDIKPGNILLTGGHAMVADFGVARAISAAIDGDAERPGELFGTPLYMSPEQLTGASRLDGRSDLYSLGCVLYEMLAGRPPFHGATAEEVRAQHLLDPPPSLASLGRDIPPEVDAMVRRLLAKVPADRFTTAQQVTDGLSVVARPSPRHLPAVPAVPERKRREARWIVGAIATVLIMVITLGAVISALTPPPQANRYVVLSTTPLGGQDSRYVGTLRDELVRWRGIEVVRELEVLEAIQEQGAPTELDDALDLARATRAGQLVRLEQHVRGDSLVFGIALTDARPGEQLLYESFACPVEGDECNRQLRNMAWRLLLGPGFETLLLPNGTSTRSVPAFRAYAAGKVAYAEWRLPEADSLLELAVIADPTFADAHLQLGEVRWWRHRPAIDWQDQLRAAMAVEPNLPVASATMALGLLALAERRYLDACDQFNALIARDSLDFAAWFGRAECLRGDRQVVRDSASASGWRFRSSYDAAIRAYRRALGLAPGLHRAFGERAYSEIASLLYTSEHQVRPGYLGNPDSMAFAAWPALDADTIVFVPWPFVQTVMFQPHTRAATQLRAVLRNRSIMADVTADWVRAFPQSTEAHIARAVALETLREGGQESGWGEAMGHAATARALARTPAARTMAAATVVRLRLKAEDYAGAARLADSLILTSGNPDTASARVLAAAAALTGHIRAAVKFSAAGAPDFLRIGPDGQELFLPVPVSETAFALLVYSAFGAPVDSIRQLEQRLDERLSAFVPAADLAPARLETTERPAVLAYESAGLRPAHRNPVPRSPMLSIQSAAARGDFSAVRDSAQRWDAAAPFRPAELSLDGTYGMVRLLLAAGDTAVAIRRLSIALASISGFGPDLFSTEVEGVVPQMALLARAMALRADLAARDGDTETARRWARAAATLWANADPPLQPLVARMRALAGISPAPPR